MKILYRYIISSILKTFFILAGIFSVVVISSQLLHIPSIFFHAKLQDFFKLLILMNLSFLKFTLLFGFFVASALFGNSLRENREIYAIYSAGISLKQLLTPVIGLSIFFSILALIISLFLVPYANRERANFITWSVKKYFLDAIQEKNFSKLTENIIVFIDKKEKNSFKNVFFFNKKTGEIITAERAFFQGLNFNLQNGSIQIPQKQGFNLLVFGGDKFSVNVDYQKKFTIEDYKNKELLKIAKSSDKKAKKAVAVLVDRLTFPLPFLFIGALGFLIGIKSQRGKDYVLSIVIVISIIYLTLDFYLLKLVSKGKLHPAVLFVVLTAYFGGPTYYFYKKD
jgi:lipopolysaccharide export system permease protein